MAFLEDDLITRWLIAQEALVVATLIPSFVIAVLTCCLAPRRKDPARKGFTWLKIATGLFTASLFFYGASDALSIALQYFFSWSSYRGLSRANAVIGGLARLFECFTEAAIIITFVVLSAGVRLVQNGNEHRNYNWAKPVAYAAGGLIVALAIATCGLNIKVRLDLVTTSYDSYGFIDSYYVARNRLDFSVAVIVFVLALALAVWATTLVVTTSKAEKRVKTAAVFLLVSSILFLFKTTYDVASYVTYGYVGDSTGYQYHSFILDIVFGQWPVFVLLVLLFSLGARKQSGLWSTNTAYTTFHPNPNNSYQASYQTPYQTPQYPQAPHPSSMYEQSSHSSPLPPPPRHEIPGQSPRLRHEMYAPPYQQQYQQFSPQGSPPPPQHQQHSPQQMHSQPPSEQRTGSPPSHAAAMGLHYQANGQPPTQQALPYDQK